MDKQLVAPGDGAFNTLRILSVDVIKKSSIICPFGETACALTPDPPVYRSFSFNSGIKRCRSFKKACFEYDL